MSKTLFLNSAVKKDDYPAPILPEVGLAGRSNVGKSSLINRLVNRRNLARISGTPGKTRTINFYQIEGKMILVDLPGYGYARVSKKERAFWALMVETYLKERETLTGLIQVVDIRHAPTEQDQQMFAWIKASDKPYLVVATKCDKISKGRWPKHIDIIRKSFAGLDPGLLVPFSARTGVGKDSVWSFLNQVIN